MNPAPKTCRVNPDGTTGVCCKLPETIVCDTAGQCWCVAPRATMLCEVRIQYPENAPGAPVMGPMGPWCDAPGVELAIAVMLARLLGAPK